MAFENFFQTLSRTASNTDYQGVFGLSSSNISLSSDLSSLSAEGSAIVTWIRYRLGEPKITCELDNKQIFAAFEEANIEYSSIINKNLAKNWLISLLGKAKNTSIDYANSLPHATLDYIRRLANPYATEAGVGGLATPRRAYINHITDTTDYDILNGFVDQTSGSSVSAYLNSISASRIEVRKVWYSDPSYVHRYYSQFYMFDERFNMESYTRDQLVEVQPVWSDVLRAGMFETADRLNKSNVTYHIYGNRLRLLPVPQTNVKVWIDYTTEIDPYNPGFTVVGGDQSVSGINSISNIPFRDIKYEDINAFGKRWIRQMSLAISMEILGRIRRKYSSIPIPNNDVTLDGDSLVSEGVEKQTQLRDQLEEEIKETNNLSIVQAESELSAAIEEQYSRVPFSTPVLMMG